MQLEQPRVVERMALTQQEAADALGVSKRQVRTWTASGKLVPKREGRCVLYPVDELKRFLNEGRQG